MPDGQKQPGPPASRAAPSGPKRRPQAPLDQGGHGEGEGHREAHVTQVQERWMECEARVLQERVEILPVEGRRGEACATGST